MRQGPDAAQRLRNLALLRRVRDRIDREYAQPLDVEALARDVHMSAGHLSREFRRAYGESPYSYLMTRRIERAMALLRRGDLSVTDVCFAVGCSSLGTFSTRFTELVGVPPSTYRRRAVDTLAGMPALAFYRDTLGFDVRLDVGKGEMRWITVGPPNQPDTSIVLNPPAANPGLTEQERRTIAEMMAKGSYATLLLATKDLDRTFEQLQANDADIVQEPTEQPYGLRDCAVRDPAGNLIRIQELR